MQCDGLAGPIETVGRIRISMQLRWLGVMIQAGCLFFQDDSLFECIGFNEESEGIIYALAYAFDPVKEISPATWRWRRSDTIFVDLSGCHARFRLPVVWTVRAADK